MNKLLSLCLPVNYSCWNKSVLYWCFILVLKLLKPSPCSFHSYRISRAGQAFSRSHFSWKGTVNLFMSLGGVMRNRGKGGHLTWEGFCEEICALWYTVFERSALCTWGMWGAGSATLKEAWLIQYLPSQKSDFLVVKGKVCLI